MSSRIPESRSYAASQQAMAAQNNQAFAREHMRARSKVIMNLVFNILVGLVTFTTLPWQLAAGITAGTFILTALLGGFSVPEVVVVARRRFSSGQLLGGSQPSAPSQARRSFAAAAPQDAGLARRLPPASQIPGTNVVRQPVADGRPREEVGSGVSGAPHFVAARSAVPPASQAAPVVHAVAAPAGPQVVAPARPIPQSNLVLQPVAQPGPREAVGSGVSEAHHLAAARSALASASNAAPVVQAVVAPAGPQVVAPARPIPQSNLVLQPVAQPGPREAVGSGVSEAHHLAAARSALASASNAAPVVQAVAAPAGPQVVAPARPIPQSNVVLQPVAQPGPREAVGTGVSGAPHFVAARSALASASNAAPVVQAVAAPAGPQVVAPARPIPPNDAAPVSSAPREAVGSGANRRGLGLAQSSASHADESALRIRARPTSVQFAASSRPTPSLVLDRSPLTQRTAPFALSSARGLFWDEEGTNSPSAAEGATPPIPPMGHMPPPPLASVQPSRVSAARTPGTRGPAEPFLPPKPQVREPVGSGRNRANLDKKGS